MARHGWRAGDLLPAAVDLQSQAMFLRHQRVEAGLKLLDLMRGPVALAANGRDLGSPDARKLAAHPGDLVAHGFFALDQMLPVHTAAWGNNRVNASTRVSASAWSL